MRFACDSEYADRQGVPGDVSHLSGIWIFITISPFGVTLDLKSNTLLVTLGVLFAAVVFRNPPRLSTSAGEMAIRPDD